MNQMLKWTSMRRRPLLALAAASLAAPLRAQSNWPDKPLRIIVPFAPGGPNDLAVRPVAQKLFELLGQPFVIDYRAGANGIIGCDIVAKSAPDGYTLLVTFATHYSLPFFQKAVPYDTLRDFTPVIAAASIHTVPSWYSSSQSSPSMSST